MQRAETQSVKHSPY